MTHDDILRPGGEAAAAAVDAMPAGPALDALVAERVAGWTCLRERPACWPAARAFAVLDPERLGTTVPPYPGPWWLPPGMALEQAPVNGIGVPEYSTDIAFAWLLTDALFAIGLQLGKHYDDFAWLEDDGDGRWVVYAEAETFPLATCRAALRLKLLSWRE